MAWFLRAIEQPDGRWACSHGHTVYDHHDVLTDTLDHLHIIADSLHPADVIVHWRDGTVERLGPA